MLVTILLLLLKTPVLHLLGATDETIWYAGQYYQYLALGAPFIIVALTPSNLIRTEGLALQSMAATILGAVVNIILDPVFIFGLNMGAGGAAIATVIGNAASVVLLVYFVRTKSRKLTVSPKNIKISGAAVASILAIGIPASVTNIMQSFGDCADKPLPCRLRYRKSGGDGNRDESQYDRCACDGRLCIWRTAASGL